MWKNYSEKYEVSTDGHIRNAKTKRILREFVGKDGYLRAQFDGKTRLIHRAIAQTFIKNPNNLPEVNHINGCKADNSVSNLEYCTRNDNLRHAYRHNLRNAKGTNNARCKLSEADVSYIKRYYIRGDAKNGATALATRFSVAPQTICAVVSGQNWKNQGQCRGDI